MDGVVCVGVSGASQNGIHKEIVVWFLCMCRKHSQRELKFWWKTTNDRREIRSILVRVLRENARRRGGIFPKLIGDFVLKTMILRNRKRATTKTIIHNCGSSQGYTTSLFLL